MPVAALWLLGRSLSPRVPVTDKERRSLHFFQQMTAPQLSEFFGNDFWERMLLQAALRESSIRHAILALGSLHERYRDKSLTTQNHTRGGIDDFTLKNYSRAINILVEPLLRGGQQAIDVSVICSILFACLEVSYFHV